MNEKQLKEISILAKKLEFNPYTFITEFSFNCFINNIENMNVDNIYIYLLLCEIKLWLIEKYDILIEISTNPYPTTFNVSVCNSVYKSNFKTYQEALSTGILETLNLINN